MTERQTFLLCIVSQAFQFVNKVQKIIFHFREIIHFSRAVFVHSHIFLFFYFPSNDFPLSVAAQTFFTRFIHSISFFGKKTKIFFQNIFTNAFFCATI